MTSQVPSDCYAGLSGLVMSEPVLSLGHGATVRKVYAHLFGSYLVAYAPAEPGKAHPGPWKAAQGGIAHDITAELFIPSACSQEFGAPEEVARALVLTLRIGVNPAASLTALANQPFVAAAQEAHGAVVVPQEVEARHFRLAVHGGVLDVKGAAAVAERWPTAVRLGRESAEFALAMDAMTIGQFVHRSALTIAMIWAALEALFSPSTTELKFRISSLIASYLEPPGLQRKVRARSVAKLYDKRSSAVHGKPSHTADDVLDSFNLLREVLTAILDSKRVPTKDELESQLFGAPT